MRIIVRKDPEHDDTVLITYVDDGKGMTRRELEKLFEPFYTTKRGQGGSGLGAHIIYTLVTGPLAGHVKASSEPGHGLQYQMRFPCFRSVKADTD